MKVVLLCGGQGSRIGEVTQGLLPKPLVPVGGRPILWHIMEIYSKRGFNEFVICAGHLSEKIKDFFFNLNMYDCDIKFETKNGSIELIGGSRRDWSITVSDTGVGTMTAGRLCRITRYLNEKDAFFLTYGDGLADIDVEELRRFHKSHGKLATITGVAPPGRFGELHLEGHQVTQMLEKPLQAGRYINGGFMVLEREFIDRYCLLPNSDAIMLEREPLEQAALDGELMMFRHDGFWQCMDTMRDWELLNRMAQERPIPWA